MERLRTAAATGADVATEQLHAALLKYLLCAGTAALPRVETDAPAGFGQREPAGFRQQAVAAAADHQA